MTRREGNVAASLMVVAGVASLVAALIAPEPWSLTRFQGLGGSVFWTALAVGTYRRTRGS